MSFEPKAIGRRLRVLVPGVAAAAALVVTGCGEKPEPTVHPPTTAPATTAPAPTTPAPPATTKPSPTPTAPVPKTTP